MRHRLLRWLGRQHWIPRGRDRILRWLCPPEEAPPLSFTVPFFGAVYPGRLDNFIDWSVFHYGGYARHELLLLSDIARALRRLRGHAPAFFDVGANVGNHSLCLAAQGSPVFAFEPYAPVRAQLLRKLQVNPGLMARVFDFGLADRDALLSFRAPAGTNVGTGSFEQAGPERDGEPRLPVRRGDEALAQLVLPPIEILKIDVEGFEPQVLKGLRERIRSDRPVILFELSDRSKAGFADLGGLQAALYENHRLFGVGTRSVSGPYRLDPFHFAGTTEALAVPAELLGPLAAEVPAFSEAARYHVNG
ncbi:MAG TPA: FkbM family methyltransferase [Alphaproteobacteria bacterium]